MLTGHEKVVMAERASVKGLIPAAGLGTRMRPVTLAVPKELLPIYRKPMIQLAVEEATAAGIREIAIVIRKGKEIIQDYFDKTEVSLGQTLSAANLKFVYQPEPLGLGDAIYAASSFIEDDPFVMIIPDQFLYSSISATNQLLRAAYDERQAVWSSVVAISDEHLKFFPGSRTFELLERTENTWKVTDLHESYLNKNEKQLFGFGRTFFPSGTLQYFSPKYINPRNGEIDLFYSFKALIREYPNYALCLEGMAMDFGTWPAYEYFLQIILLSDRNNFH
jgi:UTP--glucose-1-phosphate uridylyltransferase